jgi:hypothetical protein
MVLTVSSALSRVTGLSCHPHRRNCFHRLDASVGASGPHGFAVRKSALSSETPLTSIASQPYVRDDRETPLCAGRDGENEQVSWVKSEAEYFLIQGWTLICCVARRAKSKTIMGAFASSYLRHSGASRSDEPGIHNPSVSFSTKTPRQGLWIPGLRLVAHPGMTVIVKAASALLLSATECPTMRCQGWQRLRSCGRIPLLAVAARRVG